MKSNRTYEKKFKPDQADAEKYFRMLLNRDKMYGDADVIAKIFVSINEERGWVDGKGKSIESWTAWANRFYQQAIDYKLVSTFPVYSKQDLKKMIWK